MHQQNIMEMQDATAALPPLLSRGILTRERDPEGYTSSPCAH